MPAEKFRDHIQVTRVAGNRCHVIGKTWQGRDFIRVLGSTNDVKDVDGHPWIICGDAAIPYLESLFTGDCGYVTARAA